MTPHGILVLSCASASAVLTIWGNWDYLTAVRRGTRPRLVTWIIWTVALTLGAAGAAREGQWAAAALGLADAGTALAIIITGWRKGTRDVGWLDVAAAAAGGAGVMLLAGAMILPSAVPMGAAVTVAVLTDLGAFIPTFANARAGQEPAGPFLLFAAGGALALAGADQVTGLIYPGYLTVACIVCAVLAWRAPVYPYPGDHPAGQSRLGWGRPFPGVERARGHMPERGRSDPVADAASLLASYIPVLEHLVGEPVEDGDTPAVRSSGAVSPEPWYTPAGHALMGAWELVPRLEAALRYAKSGHPGWRRGGSAGNFYEALELLPKLAAGLRNGTANGQAEPRDEVIRALYTVIDEARMVHGIDERRRLRHLPRRPGEALPPRCPRCRCFALVADLDARLVYCTVPGCEDRNGLPPVATMEETPQGPALRWADGLTEIAPNMNNGGPAPG